MNNIERLARKLAGYSDNAVEQYGKPVKDVNSNVALARTLLKGAPVMSHAARAGTFVENMGGSSGKPVSEAAIRIVNHIRKLPPEQAEQWYERIGRLKKVEHDPFLKHYASYSRGWNKGVVSGINQSGVTSHIVGGADRVTNGGLTKGLSSLYTSPPVQNGFVKPVGTAVHNAGTAVAKVPGGAKAMQVASLGGKLLAPLGYAVDGVYGAGKAGVDLWNDNSVRNEEWDGWSYLSPSNLARVAGDRIGGTAGSLWYSGSERAAARPAQYINGKWQ